MINDNRKEFIIVNIAKQPIPSFTTIDYVLCLFSGLKRNVNTSFSTSIHNPLYNYMPSIIVINYYYPV